MTVTFVLTGEFEKGKNKETQLTVSGPQQSHERNWVPSNPGAADFNPATILMKQM